jgi:hypothetical protein
VLERHAFRALARMFPDVERELRAATHSMISHARQVTRGATEHGTEGSRDGSLHGTASASAGARFPPLAEIGPVKEESPDHQREKLRKVPTPCSPDADLPPLRPLRAPRTPSPRAASLGAPAPTPARCR